MAGWRSIWLVDRGRCRFRPTVSWQKGKGPGRVYREVERLVSLGRVGEATRRLVSPGLASETPAVKARLLSKFPSRDEATDLAYDAVVQPPEIPLESIYASIYSFRKGAGPGPDGIRGDFLRDMIGQQNHDDSMARLFRDMVQLLADGQASPFLRPFFGGGRLVGVGKKDASGNPISLETDARPIVLGLTWRKLVFKVTFALDGAGIRERLGDQQLALTKNGAEIMVHATRAWAHQHQNNPTSVLLQKDIRNAFNEARPREFLRECRAYAPASARFAHNIYATSSHLVYGGAFEQCHRGQQGCPMMGPLFCLSRRSMSELARQRASRTLPVFDVEFADDAYSGGQVSDVWAIFKEEIELASRYGLEFDFSKCTLHLLAGEQFRGDVSAFQALGVRIVTGCDLAVLKTPVLGSRGFLDSFLSAKQQEMQQIADEVARLPHKHVAFQILQQSFSFGRIQYWARTAPRELVSSLIEYHSQLHKQLMESLLEQPLPAQQWLQARLPIRSAG